MTFIAVYRTRYNFGFKLLSEYLVGELCCIPTQSKIFAESKSDIVRVCLTSDAPHSLVAHRVTVIGENASGFLIEECVFYFVLINLSLLRF
jgi:hypothetical protein